MSEHAYTANYCEENIWHLAGEPELRPGIRRVVVIAGLGASVPVWNQRLADTPDAPVFWDYHVILAVSGPHARWAYDLDTTLPCPCPLEAYVELTFGPSRHVPAPLQPMFRVLDADEYRRRLASDRSHMRDADGWLSPPPRWPPITGEAPRLLLAAATDMRDRSAGGVLCGLDGLLDALAP